MAPILNPTHTVNQTMVTFLWSKVIPGTEQGLPVRGLFRGWGLRMARRGGSNERHKVLFAQILVV